MNICLCIHPLIVHQKNEKPTKNNNHIFNRQPHIYVMVNINICSI